MKSIELTEEHKSKLLEMYNKLFPKISNSIIDDDGFINKYFHQDGEHDWIPLIHWFEFCMIHLIKKLKINYEYAGDHVISLIEHPVDYLYKEFRKTCYEKI